MVAKARFVCAVSWVGSRRVKALACYRTAIRSSHNEILKKTLQMIATGVLSRADGSPDPERPARNDATASVASPITAITAATGAAAVAAAAAAGGGTLQLGTRPPLSGGMTTTTTTATAGWSAPRPLPQVSSTGSLLTGSSVPRISSENHTNDGSAAVTPIRPYNARAVAAASESGGAGEILPRVASSSSLSATAVPFTPAYAFPVAPVSASGSNAAPAYHHAMQQQQQQSTYRHHDISPAGGPSAGTPFFRDPAANAAAMTATTAASGTAAVRTSGLASVQSSGEASGERTAGVSPTLSCQSWPINVLAYPSSVNHPHPHPQPALQFSSSQAQMPSTLAGPQLLHHGRQESETPIQHMMMMNGDTCSQQSTGRNAVRPHRGGSGGTTCPQTPVVAPRGSSRFPDPGLAHFADLFDDVALREPYVPLDVKAQGPDAVGAYLASLQASDAYWRALNAHMHNAGLLHQHHQHQHNHQHGHGQVHNSHGHHGHGHGHGHHGHHHGAGHGGGASGLGDGAEGGGGERGGAGGGDADDGDSHDGGEGEMEEVSVPTSSDWDGDYDDDDEAVFDDDDVLTEDERQWLQQVADRKIHKRA